MEEINNFFCADINKKKMRKIIIIDNKKKKKKLLIKNLNITFNDTIKEKKKIKIKVNNFLPKQLKDNETVKYDNYEYKEDLHYIYNLYELQKKKMIKIINDFFYNILIFCINKNLSVTEISTFLSIKKHIFFKLLNDFFDIKSLFIYFKNIMLNHSIKQSPYSIKVFSFHSLNILIQYSLNTFFKYFSFYQFIFNPSYKIYFECVDNIKNNYKIISKKEDYIIPDNALSLDMNVPNHINYVKSLIKLNVGSSIHMLNSMENNENLFIKELKNYLKKYEIKDTNINFSLNSFKKENNIKIINENNEQTNIIELHEKNNEKTEKNQKEKLIKKIDIMYDDLENRIISRFNDFLNITKK